MASWTEQSVYRSRDWPTEVSLFLLDAIAVPLPRRVRALRSVADIFLQTMWTDPAQRPDILPV